MHLSIILLSTNSQVILGLAKGCSEAMRHAEGPNKSSNSCAKPMEELEKDQVVEDSCCEEEIGPVICYRWQRQ